MGDDIQMLFHLAVGGRRVVWRRIAAMMVRWKWRAVPPPSCTCTHAHYTANCCCSLLMYSVIVRQHRKPDMARAGHLPHPQKAVPVCSCGGEPSDRLNDGRLKPALIRHLWLEFGRK